MTKLSESLTATQKLICSQLLSALRKLQAKVEISSHLNTDALVTGRVRATNTCVAMSGATACACSSAIGKVLMKSCIPTHAVQFSRPVRSVSGQTCRLSRPSSRRRHVHVQAGLLSMFLPSKPAKVRVNTELVNELLDVASITDGGVTASKEQRQQIAQLVS